MDSYRKRYRLADCLFGHEQMAATLRVSNTSWSMGIHLLIGVRYTDCNQYSELSIVESCADESCEEFKI